MNDFFHYLSLPFLWEGLGIAMEISAIAFLGSLPFALGVALMRMSKRRSIRAIMGPYIWVMRGTPILLQLLFWYNVLPLIGINVSAFWTAIISLGLNEIAFSGEIIRGGLLSVKQTQRDAAAALGMSRWQVLHRVVLPQALRSIAPAMSNEAIIMIKNTSLASVITVGELTLRSEQVVATNFQYVAVFMAAGVMYLVATTVVVLAQRHFEQRLDVEYKAEAMALRMQRAREAGQIAVAVGTPVPAGASATAGSGPRGAAGDGLRQRITRLRVKGSQRLGFLRRGAPELGLEVSGAPSNGLGAEPDAATSSAEALAALSEAQEAGKSGEAYVVMREVRKSFQGTEVLHGVSLDVERGSVVFLIGPSGSGKTTLLRTINHLETVDGGEITVGGEYVGYRSTPKGLVATRDVAQARARARIGMVFQHFNLFDHLTVIENIVDAPVRVYGRKIEDVRREARGLLAWAGLGGHEHHYPHQLSGGQQQRVAIIRAVATHPRLMLFDEPTSALDPELVSEVLELMRRLAEAGMTMAVVSHEIVFARDWADKVVFMEAGQIIEQGRPETVFNHPRSERTRNFIRLIEQRGAGKAPAPGVTS